MIETERVLDGNLDINEGDFLVPFPRQPRPGIPVEKLKVPIPMLHPDGTVGPLEYTWRQLDSFRRLGRRNRTTGKMCFLRCTKLTDNRWWTSYKEIVRFLKEWRGE